MLHLHIRLVQRRLQACCCIQLSSNLSEGIFVLIAYQDFFVKDSVLSVCFYVKFILSISVSILLYLQV